MPINDAHKYVNEFIGDAEIERREAVKRPQATPAERRAKFEQFLDKRQERHLEAKKKSFREARDTINESAAKGFKVIDRAANKLLKKSKGAEKYKPEVRQNAAIKRITTFNERFKRY